MAMDKGDVISVLNDLIETSEDGVKDFRACADAVKNSEAKSFFNDRVQLIERGLRELTDEVRRLGGDPEQHGTARGAMRRGLIDVRSALSGKDDGAVLTECARAEEAAVKKYQDVLKQDLPTEVRSIVERQLGGVMENRDRVRMLRDNMSAASPGMARGADREAPPPA